jgi:hypothetical protein
MRKNNMKRPYLFFMLTLFSMGLLCMSHLLAEDSKPITQESRIGLIRSLGSEFITLKVPLPVNKKGLVIDEKGDFDWQKNEKELAQTPNFLTAGTIAQITQLVIENNRLIFEVNGGGKKKKNILEHIEVGAGGGSVPLNRPKQHELPKGSYLIVQFGKFVPDLTPDQVKEILANVADFSRKSATRPFIETVPEEFKEAAREKRAEVGMDKDLVLAILGRPLQRVREKKGDTETEDWIYGEKPNKVTFITFTEGKVVSVKEY